MQVLTGDIIDSTKLSNAERKGIAKTLESLASSSKGQYDFFIRGDSFQVMLEKGGLSEALRIKYLLRLKTGLSARISIGIGTVNILEERLSNSDGPAFWLSGQGLDVMKDEKTLISIHTEDELKNAEWKLHAATLDYLERTNTLNQMEVHYWLLLDNTQQEIAEEIGIRQSSVNRRIKNSGWNLIENIVSHFDHTL
ncbi:SatD family protein [uncultured Arcticibacterium sp.]|uniref:SatD family protein n=1 Tax=uncultured Arcticibacterium sp. TaxID=2173042 RepID=UPI0030F58A55